MADQFFGILTHTTGNLACSNYRIVLTAYDRMFKKKPKNPV